MKSMIVRRIPKIYHLRIKQLADKNRLSVNQYSLNLIIRMSEKEEKDEFAHQRKTDIFKKMDQLREEIYREYGSFDDSTDLIREDRDQR